MIFLREVGDPFAVATALAIALVATGVNWVHAQANPSSLRQALTELHLTTPDGAQWRELNGDHHAQSHRLHGESCNSLDRIGGVQNELNNLVSGRDAIRQRAQSSITQSLTSLPWLVVKRAMPEVADLFDLELSRAELRVERLLGDCRASTGRRQSRAEGLTSWRTIAEEQQWRSSAEHGISPQEAEDVVGSAGRAGVFWVTGDDRGGEGQPPIRVVADVLEVGLEQIFAQSSPQAYLDFFDWAAQEVGGSDQAKDVLRVWVSDVLGEYSLRFTGGQFEGATTAGVGLWSKLTKSEEYWHAQMQSAVRHRTQTANQNAADATARLAKAGISLHLIDAIASTVRAGAPQRYSADFLRVVTADHA